jgi:pimeloyl-ACP methyl ester carboxylesterase
LGEADEIRVSRSALTGVRLDAVVDHYERIVRGLETAPILIGHSTGGMIVKLMIDRGLGAAGVVIDQSQKSDVPGVAISNVDASRGAFGKSFALNKGVSLSEAARMLKEGAFALLNPKARSRASFRKAGRAPVLVIDGAKGRGHNTLAQPGWQEIADFALRWALENSSDRMTVDQVKAAFAPPVLTESREHQVQM